MSEEPEKCELDPVVVSRTKTFFLHAVEGHLHTAIAEMEFRIMDDMDRYRKDLGISHDEMMKCFAFERLWADINEAVGRIKMMAHETEELRNRE